MTDQVIHAIGNCVDPSYGGDWCDGIAHLGPDPWAEEIHGDSTPVWMCDGARAGSAADI